MRYVVIVVLGFLSAWGGLAHADSIVIDGVRYDQVKVYESDTRYYVKLPSGKVMGVAKSQVAPSDVSIDRRKKTPAPKAPRRDAPVGRIDKSMAPDFKVQCLDGTTMQLSALRGRYVLLDFWATWCGPCVGEVPYLEETFNTFGSDPRFVMLSLSLDREIEKVQTFVKSRKIRWPQGWLGDWQTSQTAKAYGVDGIPHIILIDPEGSIVAQGLRGPGIMRAVARALDEASPARATNAPGGPRGASPVATASPSAWNARLFQEYDAESFRQFAPAKATIDRDTIDFELLSAAIYYATNAARARNDKGPLLYSAALSACALDHSKDMSAGGFFSHENPNDPAKRTVSMRLAAHGIPQGAWAENIAALGARNMSYVGYADAIVATWMKSPGHRANILNGGVRYLGCGACPCQCPKFHLLATQNFAVADR